MPVITIDMHHSDEQTKLALIRNLTAASVEATKIPAQFFTILINEMDQENIGLGGKSLAELHCTK